MRPLTLDDMLSLDGFASRRGEFFASLGRYLDRYRRVRIGPRLTLVFENRQTLWFRVQDLLRVARLSEPKRIQQELALYNRLLPHRDQLQAALLIETVEEARLSEQLAPYQSLRGEDLSLVLGDVRYPAVLLTCRPEDRCIGTAFWVQFALDRPGRRLLGEFHRPAQFALSLQGELQESGPLSEEVRQSLLEDLELSDQDAA